MKNLMLMQIGAAYARRATCDNDSAIVTLTGGLRIELQSTEKTFPGVRGPGFKLAEKQSVVVDCYDGHKCTVKCEEYKSKVELLVIEMPKLQCTDKTEIFYWKNGKYVEAPNTPKYFDLRGLALGLFNDQKVSCKRGSFECTLKCDNHWKTGGLMLTIEKVKKAPCTNNTIKLVKDPKNNKWKGLPKTLVVPLHKTFTLGQKKSQVVLCKDGTQSTQCTLFCLDHKRSGEPMLFVSVKKVLQCTKQTAMIYHTPDGPKPLDASSFNSTISLAPGASEWIACDNKSGWCQLKCKLIKNRLRLVVKDIDRCDHPFDGVRKLNGRVHVKELCSEGYELNSRVQFANMGEEVLEVECSKSKYNIFQKRKVSGQWTDVRTKDLMGHELCVKIAEWSQCVTKNLTFEDRSHNRSDMYELSDARARFQYGQPIEVQCKHSKNKTKLQCLRGQVVRNYDCPEMDQEDCPNLSSLEKYGFDISYGCIKMSVSSIGLKCKYPLEGSFVNSYFPTRYVARSTMTPSFGTPCLTKKRWENKKIQF